MFPVKPHFHTPALISPFSCSESDVKQLWLQLKKDEPHLLSNFEDFLTRIFSQLQEAHEEKNELECALRKWVPSLSLSLCICVKNRNTQPAFSYILYSVMPPYCCLPEWGPGLMAVIIYVFLSPRSHLSDSHHMLATVLHTF